jgi:uncharacterized protein (TIGR00661 family)
MKKIIIAPLNWGLGHATRCVPIIKELQKSNFTPVIASDGTALQFLIKEFPSLEFFELPSYKISYGRNLKWSLIRKIPTIVRAVHKERLLIQEYIHQNPNVVGIISDNRFGCYYTKIPSVYITHQLNVLSGFLSPVTSFFHRRVIRKYNECWIPDEENSVYSGKLSRSSKNLNQKYIGVLSRFKKQELPQDIDVLILLSGPEPNRTRLEIKLTSIFKTSSKKVYLIQGIVEKTQKTTKENQLTIVNFMLTKQLEHTLNLSKMVICRAGYSSVLDLVSLRKKALLIPTKFQNEQEYLAKYLQQKGYFSFVKERKVNKNTLDVFPEFTPANYQKKVFNSKLFHLFHGK